MSEYGDYDIEDAWDAGDPDEHLISNIDRRIDRLELVFAHIQVNTNADILDQFIERMKPINKRRNDVAEIDRGRIDRIYDDIQFMRDRRGE